MTPKNWFECDPISNRGQQTLNMQANVEIRQSQASPTFICWLLFNITSWSQGPSVTYGLCMLSEFPAIAERTNAEFSISAGRWGSRFAFFFTICIWGASQQNPLPRSHTQQLVISRVWPQIFKILLFFLSYILHRHWQPWGKLTLWKCIFFSLSLSFSPPRVSWEDAKCCWPLGVRQQPPHQSV